MRLGHLAAAAAATALLTCGITALPAHAQEASTPASSIAALVASALGSETGNATSVDLSASGNVDLSSAAPVGMGQRVSDTLVKDSVESKFYTFTLDQAGCVTFDVTAQWSEYRAAYTVYDAAGEALWAMSNDVDWNDATAQASRAYDIDLTAGTYYLEVSHQSWGDEPGSFVFSLSFTAAGESATEVQGGSNNSLATASVIQLGQEYVGQIAINDRADFYQFSLEESGTVTLDIVTAFEPYYNATYRLFDTAGIELWSATPADDWNKVTQRAVSKAELPLAAGTYCFVFEQASDNSPDWGVYAFSLGFASAHESFPESAGGSNNSLPTASPIELGASYNAQLAYNDTADFFSFALPAATTVRLDLTASWHTVYDTLHLYDAGGSELWACDNDGDWDETTGQALTSVELELAAGTYYFAVERQGSCAGPYTFCWGTSGAPLTPAAGGAGSGQTGASGQTGPVADGTYASSATGSLGAISMTVEIRDGQLVNVVATVEGGILPDEYAQLFARCIEQARQG